MADTVIFVTVSLESHAHTCLTALCPGLPGWAGTRKVKPIWILLKQETVSGSGISWAICKSAPRSGLNLFGLQIDNASTPPLSFLQAGCPSCRPTNKPTVSTHWRHCHLYQCIVNIITHTSRLKCKKTVIIVMHTFDNNRSRLHI